MTKNIFAGLCLSLLLGATALLTSCAGGVGWFQGSWEIDIEKTKEELTAPAGQTQPPPQQDPSPNLNQAQDLAQMGEQLGEAMQDVVSDLTTGLKGALGTMMVQQMHGMKMVVKDNEITSIMPNGSGESHTFEIIDQPDADTIIIKTEDGEVSTWRREGPDLISTGTEGDKGFRVYFRRMDS